MIAVGQTLQDIANRLFTLTDTPELEAQTLLAHVMGKPRTWLIAHPEQKLMPKFIAALEKAVQQRELGVPLPYIIGQWEFFNLNFDLTPSVLIPRPETELLVERAIAWWRKYEHNLGDINILDVGTGCGCIAIALAVNIPDIHVFATDISPDALEVARHNAKKFLVHDRIDFMLSDLIPEIDEHIQDEKNGSIICAVPANFDMILANLPYIPTHILNGLVVAKYEPRIALDGGEDGLSLIRRFLSVAPSRLSIGGMILLEIESSQGPAALSLAYDAFNQGEIHLHQDLAERDRLLEIHL